MDRRAGHPSPRPSGLQIILREDIFVEGTGFQEPGSDAGHVPRSDRPAQRERRDGIEQYECRIELSLGSRDRGISSNPPASQTALARNVMRHP